MADKFEVEFSRNLHKETTEVTEGEEVFIYYRSEKVDSRLRGNDERFYAGIVDRSFGDDGNHKMTCSFLVIPAQAGIHIGLEV